MRRKSFYVICEKVLKPFLSSHTSYQLEKQLVQLAGKVLNVGERSVALQYPVPEISEVTKDKHTVTRTQTHTQNTRIQGSLAKAC